MLVLKPEQGSAWLGNNQMCCRFLSQDILLMEEWLRTAPMSSVTATHATHAAMYSRQWRGWGTGGQGAAQTFQQRLHKRLSSLHMNRVLGMQGGCRAAVSDPALVARHCHTCMLRATGHWLATTVGWSVHADASAQRAALKIHLLPWPHTVITLHTNRTMYSKAPAVEPSAPSSCVQALPVVASYAG